MYLPALLFSLQALISYLMSLSGLKFATLQGNLNNYGNEKSFTYSFNKYRYEKNYSSFFGNYRS